ncbi:MAG: hypothetical protein ACLGIR_09835 [Actinomycetes bacterium]
MGLLALPVGACRVGIVVARPVERPEDRVDPCLPNRISDLTVDGTRQLQQQGTPPREVLVQQLAGDPLNLPVIVEAHLTIG